MFPRKFGSDIENLVKQKSNNHIVLKSRSFSFDGKNKPPAHITRRTSFADSKPPVLQVNRSVIIPSIINEKQSQLPNNIQKDEQIVPHFLKDCIAHMKNQQGGKKIKAQLIKQKNPQYLQKRAQIIDWMVRIHYDLKLFSQTLFIAVSYIDDFCSKTSIQQSDFYVVAATCIFIAGKFQETYHIPSIRAIQQCADYPLEREKIIKMEERIMENLNFGLIIDTPIKYLELFSKISNLSDKNFYIAQYILELSLVELTFLQYTPSVLGCAVTYLVNKIRKISPCWPSQFKDLVGYEQSQLRTCAKYLCSLLQRSQEIENARNIRHKFSKTQFCSASNIRLQRKNQ